jgi:anaerobic selenocysteine-containing dehydrogenase
MDAPVQTTCPYCGVGCGVIVQPDDRIGADPSHPSNRGRLCSKGAALGATLDDSERLTTPLIGGRGVSWDEALALMTARFQETIAAHGPDSVAFYLSGQFLTEDYYVANKLMKGFIGSANIDTNSRLCMASSAAGHVRAFGEDLVPGVYEDWEDADLVVLVGSNAAWCHPVLYQRLIAARAAHGTRVVVVDPRRTATAEAADLHLPVVAGSDVVLFNGLLVHLAQAGWLDHAWLERHAEGLGQALAAARAECGGEARVEGSRAVRGRAGRAGQGALDRCHQSRRQHAARGPRAPGARRLPLSRRLGLLGDRHHHVCRCAAAGRRLEREGWHGDQLRASHLAPARLPCSTRRGAAGLVDVCRDGAPHGLGGAVRLARAIRGIPRARRTLLL